MISVKPHDAGNRARDFGCRESGRFISTGTPLNRSIAWAFDIEGYQVLGLPQWAEGTPVAYDIEAKTAGPTSLVECKAFVAALLADRFGMTTHWDSKRLNVNVYELIIAKNGPKLQKVTDSDTEPVKFSLNGNRMALAPGAPKDAKLAVGWTMAELAQSLALAAGAPVIDKTGLDGVYKINLAVSLMRPNGELMGNDPDVFTAVEKSMGLKLQQARDPFKVLVVDRLNKPGPN